MTHGATTKWMQYLPFNYLKKTQIRLPFIVICILILVVFLLSATYYSSFPVIGQFQPVEYETFRNACIERTNTSTTSPTNVTELKTSNFRKVRLNTTGFLWNDTRLDILHMKIPPFDTRFKNPCWFEALEDPNPYDENAYTSYSPSARDVLDSLAFKLEDKFFEQLSPKRLRCLPYFLIIGQPKCGSTDLFWKIAKHGSILTPPIKELHWWSRNRQGRRFSYKKLIPFEDYVDMFDEAAFQIEEWTLANPGIKSGIVTRSRQSVTGEASVSLFWDNNDWVKLPENKDQSEPLYITPHYIHQIIPDVKLILMLRDPVERMYSDYLYFNNKNKSADDFHNAVSYAVEVYHNCSIKHGMRGCVYNLSVANRVRVRLRVGLYSVYLQDWLKVFPRDQFFILRLEDYSENQLDYIKQIDKFLGLRELNQDEADEVTDQANYNSRKASDRELGGMHAMTRKTLQEFYRPFNEDLASILGDKRFLWQDSNKKKQSNSTVNRTTFDM